MERYELLYIVSPQAEEKELSAVKEHVEKIIARYGGKIVSYQDAEKRKLATPIQKFRHGFYFLYNFDLDSQKVDQLDKEIKIIELIIRYIVVHYDKRTLAKMEEQKDRVRFVTDPQKVTADQPDVADEDDSTPASASKPALASAKQEVVKAEDVEKDLEVEKTEKPKEKPIAKKKVADSKDLDKKLDEILEEDII